MSENENNMLVDDAVGMLIYLLLQHHIPAGSMEGQVNMAVLRSEDGVARSPLAEFADSLSNKLQGAKVHNMAEKLTKIFDAPLGEDGTEDDVELEGPLFSRDSEKELEEELELLRPEIEEAAKDLDPEKDYQELVAHAQALSDELKEEAKEGEQKLTTLKDAEDIVAQMGEKGLLSPEQVKSIEKDIEEFKDGWTSDTEE